MLKTKWKFGQHQPQQDAQKPVAVSVPVVSTANAKKFGLENFGNTCYANSVLQALYFCAPFRELMLQSIDNSVSQEPVEPILSAVKPPPPVVPLRRKPERKGSMSTNAPETTPTSPLPTLPPIPSSPPTLFSALRSLFGYIASHPSDKGTVAPRAFIDKLKEINELFRSTMHQDAHEFLNYLLNRIVEEIEEERKQSQNGATVEDLTSSIHTLASKVPPTTSSNSGTSPQDATLVHKLFEGVLTSETRCLTCETVSSRDESFLDLSIDIEQNSSVTACLRQFSASEMLCQRNKFFCDSCCDLQEAEKRMKIKKLPNILALHLKRFKYQEDVQKYIKLAYRVAFPFELRLFNTVDDMDNADRLYNLFAIVVHIGNGPHHGHYVSIIKTLGKWLVFDDDNVYEIGEGDIAKYFGESNSGSAYVLYYQAADIDLSSLGLRSSRPESVSNMTPPRPVSPIQTQPAVPPGLSEPDDSSSNSSDSPPPATPASSSPPNPIIQKTPAYELPKLITPILPDSRATVEEADNSVPITPTSRPKNPFLGALRRHPSTSRTPPVERPGTSSTNDSTSATDHAKPPFIERKPLPSASAPSLVHDPTPVELPPPLPIRLTPSLGTSNNKEERNPKEVEKGTWFGKRKSIRLSGKLLRTDEAPLPSSPAVHKADDEQHGHQHWYKPNVRWGEKLRPPSTGEIPSGFIPEETTSPRPKSSAGPAKSRVILPRSVPGTNPDKRLSTQHPQGLTPTSLPTSSPTPLQRPSTSTSSVNEPRLDNGPTRKTSLMQLSGDHKPQYKRESKPSIPALPRGMTLPVKMPSGYDMNRDLPAPPPPAPASHNRQTSNGYHMHMSEPESLLDKGMSRSPGDYALREDLDEARPLPPGSLSLSMGANNSSSSAGSTGSNPMKRATRKLSLTAPMLGFGKKDKDKNRYKERDGH